MPPTVHRLEEAGLQLTSVDCANLAQQEISQKTAKSSCRADVRGAWFGDSENGPEAEQGQGSGPGTRWIEPAGSIYEHVLHELEEWLQGDGGRAGTGEMGGCAARKPFGGAQGRG